ncbi:MAG: GNAT family N-acetyltransferase [Bdellovibrionota bacterium]
MEVRPATSRDLDACFALDASLNEGRPQAADEGFLISGDRRQSYDGYRSLGCFYVCESDKRIVGFAFALPPGSEHFEAIHSQRAGFQMTEAEVWDTPNLGWMGKVAVQPDWMRRGVGTRLYQRIFSDHPEWSFLTMNVSAPVANIPGARFHSSCGFEAVGEGLLGDRGALKNVKADVLFRKATGLS